MKNQIMMFLLGVFVVVSVAATSAVNFTEVKPIRPTNTHAKEFYYSNDAVRHINEYTAKGWQLKFVTSAAEKSSYIVVLEKY